MKKFTFKKMWDELEKKFTLSVKVNKLNFNKLIKSKLYPQEVIK